MDGGVTTYNNPAFMAFLMATVEPYNLGWPAGEDKMLIVSVGTGTSPTLNKDLNPDEMNLLSPQRLFHPLGPDVRRPERTGFPLPQLWQVPGWRRPGPRDWKYDRQKRP